MGREIRLDEPGGKMRMKKQRHYILIEKEPVPADDILTWIAWMKSANNIIEQTDIGDIKVSTVFLGLDRQWKDGPPLLFETMIFGGEHDEDQWRYATWEEAEQGHTYAIDLVKNESATD